MKKYIKEIIYVIIIFILGILIVSCTPEKEQKKYYAYVIKHYTSHYNLDNNYIEDKVEIEYQGKISLNQFEHNCQTYKDNINKGEKILIKGISELTDSLNNLKSKKYEDKQVSLLFCKAQFEAYYIMFFSMNETYIICSDKLVEQVKKDPYKVIHESDKYIDDIKIFNIPNDTISTETLTKFMDLRYKLKHYL